MDVWAFFVSELSLYWQPNLMANSNSMHNSFSLEEKVEVDFFRGLVPCEECVQISLENNLTEFSNYVGIIYLPILIWVIGILSAFYFVLVDLIA